MNWLESYFATSSYDVTTTWFYLYILKERVGMNWHELHTRTIPNHFTFTFRDNYSEYQDHMDIMKCIPSIKISDLSLRDPLEKQVTLASSSLSPKGAIG